MIQFAPNRATLSQGARLSCIDVPARLASTIDVETQDGGLSRMVLTHWIVF